MEFEIRFLPSFLGVVALLGLAAWILYQDPTSRVRRAFSLFLLLLAVVRLVNILAFLSDDSLYWAGVRGYFVISLIPALINFFIVYNWRPGRGVRNARLLLLAVTVLVEAVYLANHDILYVFRTPTDFQWGPLGFLIPGWDTVAGAFAYWFIGAARNADKPHVAQFHRLLALGFASAALADGILPWSRFPFLGVDWLFPEGYGLVAVSNRVFALLAAPLAIGAFVLLAVDVARRREHVPSPAWVIGIGIACLLVPAIGASWTAPYSTDAPLSTADFLFFLVLALTRLIFPAVVAYAIARHTLSDSNPFALDYSVKITIRRSTIGSFFVTAFFVVSKTSEAFFEDSPWFEGLGPLWSQLLGVLAAGLLLVALNPLQRVAERVSRSALPNAKPQEELTRDERVRLYSEQAGLAWADGTLTRKERILLDRLRERLGIPVDDAVRLESRLLRAPS